MKTNMKLFSTAFLALLLLTACNTAEEPKQASEPTNEEVNTDEKIETNEQQVTEPQINEPQETEEQPSSTKEEEPANTNSITYTTNGDEVTEETTTIDSENYSIQTIPGFILTPEEPGKDMLYLEENDEVSMRIETMSTNTTTYDKIIANTEETMAAIGEYESFPVDSYVESHSDISKASAYMVTFETEKVIMVVFEKGNMISRLTIYDNTTVDLTDAMIKMGLTIQTK